MNEVWAGKPVNMAAKLSSVAEPNQVVVSDRVFPLYERGSKLCRRALIWSCGCGGGTSSAGLDMLIGSTECLWHQDQEPDGLGLGFAGIHQLNTLWCQTHGAESCEAIVTGRRAGG